MSDLNQAQRQMKNLADNLKKTNLGITFTRRLFTNPDSLSPKQITATLKALGLNIPAEIQASAEIAQIITTGQAISSAVKAGQDINDIKAMTNTTAMSIRAINSIGSQNGWFDQDTASIIDYGVNTSMIIATAGTDVSAWVGLAMDVASTIASKQGEADMQALQDVRKKFEGTIKPQSKILGDTFADLQTGKISIYGVIAKMAVETPDLWPQIVNQGSPFATMFPELLMLPTVSKTIWGYGESRIWGDWPWPASGSYVLASWNSNKSIQYTSINQMSKEEAAEYFFNILLKPWITSYAIANDENSSRGGMKMSDIAALSFLINSNGQISSMTDYVSFLLGSNLTPYDFGDSILSSLASDYLENSYKNIPHSFVEQGISAGRSGINNGFQAYEKDFDRTLEKIKTVKESDSIWALVQTPFIYKKLQDYMQFPQTSFEKDPSFGGKIEEKFSSKSVTAWRELHNYIAVLQMLSTFRSDSYLKTTRFASQLAPYMPSIDDFDQKIQSLHYLSTMRSVNKLALNQLADLLSVRPSQLQKQTNASSGAAIFSIKR